MSAIVLDDIHLPTRPEKKSLQSNTKNHFENENGQKMTLEILVRVQQKKTINMQIIHDYCMKIAMKTVNKGMKTYIDR